MSKQPAQPQGTHPQSPHNNQKARQSHGPQDRANNPAHRERDQQFQEGGGEESKHGRKQKGNVDDT